MTPAFPTNRSKRSRVGISIETPKPAAILHFIESAEAAGVEQLWLGPVSESADALSIFAAAGHPIPDDCSVPTSSIESLVVMGDENAVAERLIELLDSGLDELLISNLVIGNREDVDDRLIRLVGGL